VKIISSHYLCN